MMTMIALVVLVIAGWRGYRAGLLTTALSLVGLVVGYIVAYNVWETAGESLADMTSLPLFIAYPAAGLAVVLGVSTLGSIAHRFARRRRREKVAQGWEAPVWDGAGGAVINCAWAALFLLLIGWALIWLQTVSPAAPKVRDTVVGRLASSFVGSVVQSVTESKTGNPTLARTAAAIARDPKKAAGAVNSVLANPLVQTMVADPELSDRPLSSLISPEQLQNLAADPTLVQHAYDAGLVDTAPDDLSSEELQQKLKEGLTPVVTAVASLARDKEIQDMLQDPELLAKLQGGQLQHLMGDPQFENLVKRVWKQVAASRPQAGFPDPQRMDIAP